MLRLSIVLTAAALTFVPAGPAAAQEPAPPASDVAGELTLSEVTVAVRGDGGEAVPGLSPDEITVREAERERQVLEVRREGRPWRVVVVFDLALAAPRTPARAARSLEAMARDLTSLGTVEMMLAAETPRLVLPPSRDPLEVSAALSRVALMEQGEDRLVALRRESLAELAESEGDAQRRAVVAQAVAREEELVRERGDVLLGWLLREPAEDTGGPAVVLWVGDGFDLDPAEFWRRRAGEEAEVSVPADAVAGDPALARDHRGLARALAALGWTVVPVSLRGDAPEGEEGVLSRFGAVEQENPASGETEVLGTFRLPRRRSEGERAREQVEAERQAGERERLGPPPLPVAPRVPLEALAEASGGRLVTQVAELPELVADLGSRFRVRYATLSAAEGGEGGDGVRQESEGDTIGGVEPLTVSAAGAGRTAVARRWTARGLPPAVSALRARRLLAGELDPGRVTVRAALGFEAPPRGGAPQPARLEVRLETPPGEPPPRPGARRLTLAAEAAAGGAPRLIQRTVEGGLQGEAKGAAGSGTVWNWSGQVELPPGSERVAVVVEEAGGGSWSGESWGGTVAGIFDTFRGTGDGFDVAGGLLPAPKAVNLLRPSGLMLSGEERFETVVTPGVARVEFLVDGRRRETVSGPPFAATLDLGRLPLPRRVEAVAYGAGGAEVGRDELLVNGGGGRFRVRITEPAGDRAVGAVDVTVDVEVPEGAAFDRLELYWEDRLVATLFQPPYRHRLQIPEEAPEGFLRALGRLADGTQAEDVRYLNGPLAAERVDVRLTELYVVVADRRGRPVRGLGREDFRVREDGRRQRIAVFSDAGELPITVGLAVDSSASMFVKLPDVQEAAADFLGQLTAGRDRAFLVDFDDRVQLAAGPTRDLERVRRATWGLAADGRTSLWKAIVFSLVQIQSAPGRKALVVYSDGADEDEDFSYRTALAFARKVGVPIYVIVSNDEAVRTGGLPFGVLPSLGRRLERLVDEVGGRLWLVRSGDDLSGVYRQIQRELSAQYLLGYYPQRDDERQSWRRVRVDVLRPGFEARTLSGYER